MLTLIKQRKPVRLVIMTLFIFIVVTAVINLTSSIKTTRETIINLTLERALIEKKIPDYSLLTNKRKSVILSSEDLLGYNPKIPGVNLIILSPEQIQERADAEGDFLYLRFSSLNVNRLKAEAELNNNWVISKSSKNAYLSGGGFTISYVNIGLK